MTLQQRFTDFVRSRHLFTNKDRLLVAVSGGIDSVVLCELCHQGGFAFAIVHCNFQLRGEESERDERFVRSLAEKYGVKLHLKAFNVDGYAKREKISVQLAARYLRYQWFGRLTGGAWKVPPGHQTQPDNDDVKVADYLLTAHHADDNLETLLMNFFKGTGISGLRGMEARQEWIRRPLLFARKRELMQFASKNGLPWVEDSSNITQKYSRNQIRHSLIPAIAAMYPSVEENLLKNIERFADIEQLYHKQIETILGKLLVKAGNEIRIPILKLKQLQAVQTVCYEIIKNFGFTPSQAGEMVDLFDAGTGKYLLSSTHRIIKHRNHFIMAPLPTQEAHTTIIENYDGEFLVNEARIRFSVIAADGSALDTAPSVAMLDASKIRLPLILRKRGQGDYFYPLGMKKKKKISRFLSDIRLPLPQKERVWLLEMDKKIVWVIGHRIDDRFKVTANTKMILKVEYATA